MTTLIIIIILLFLVIAIFKIKDSDKKLQILEKRITIFYSNTQDLNDRNYLLESVISALTDNEFNKVKNRLVKEDIYLERDTCRKTSI